MQQVTGSRQLHEFCWINMLTRDMEAEQKFFADLFDWTYGAIPGMGFTIKVQGCDVGGLFDLDHPNTPKGLPAHIGMCASLTVHLVTRSRIVRAFVLIAFSQLGLA
jgi:predicted enzyme related to lactoylglutathione lyase